MTRSDSQYWQEVGTHWQRTQPQRLWRRYCDVLHTELLDSWLPRRRVARVLKTDLFDEAVSDGVYPLLARRAGHVVGIDVSQSIRQAAGEQYPDLETLEADVRCLPLAGESFDAVVSLSTLDHFDTQEEIVRALRELGRVIRPGGHLLLTVDNPANPAVRLRNALPWRWLHRLGLVPYRVGATCGRRRLEDYMRHAGLSVLQATAIMHCPRAAAVALAGWLERRDRSPQRAERLLHHLLKFEKLRRWPTRFRTGYFLATLAVKVAEAPAAQGSPIPMNRDWGGP